MTLLLFVGGMFVFVHLSICCDSFSVSTSQFSICATPFIFVRFVLYLCDSFSVCATQFSICATPFIFVRFVWYLCDSVLYLCDSFCICAWQLWATVFSKLMPAFSYLVPNSRVSVVSTLPLFRIYYSVAPSFVIFGF